MFCKIIQDSQSSLGVDLKYSNNVELEALISSAISCVESGTPNNTGIEIYKVIKKTPTFLLAPNNQHKEERFHIGAKLVTFNGVDKNGKLIRETWDDGVAVLNDNSVILRNENPITYPDGHALAGQVVKGRYLKAQDHKEWEQIEKEALASGKVADPNEILFEIDQNGPDMLFNEYVSDTGFVKDNYGIEVTTEWQKALKLEPSYAVHIPDDFLEVKNAENLKISVQTGDYVMLSVKKGAVNDVFAITEDWLDQTYKDYDQHLEDLADIDGTEDKDAEIKKTQERIDLLTMQLEKEKQKLEDLRRE